MLRPLYLYEKKTCFIIAIDEFCEVCRLVIAITYLLTYSMEQSPS